MTSEPTDHAESTRRLRVLIVDDNRDAADSLAVLVRMWGCETLTAYDAEGGLELARIARPDCLVLDIGMPGTDGYALARQVRDDAELRGAKLIALSAYSSEEHHRQAGEAGFEHCLVKPADPIALEGLLTMLQQTLRLAERTEALAQKNVQIAQETKELLVEVKEELKEVKDELKEVKDELKEVKSVTNGDNPDKPTTSR